MAGGIRVQSGVGDHVANVDANKNLQVNLPVVPEQSGYSRSLSELDDGSQTGAPLLLAPEVSNDYRYRVGTDTCLFEENFLGAALNSSLWTAPVTTQTVAVGSALLTLNSASSVAANGVSRVRSQRCFPVMGSYTTWLSFTALHRTDFINNCVMDFGMAYASGTTEVTDGAFFRVTSAGTFQAVVSVGGNDAFVEEINPALWPTNVFKSFLIGLHQDRVTFWIGNVLVAAANLPDATSTFVPSGELPIHFRQYVTALAMAQAQQLVVGRVGVDLGEYATGKAHEDALSGMGRTALLNQFGTPGSSLSYALSAAPVAAIPTATTSALVASSLGGQFAETDTLAAETDGIIQSFQVPAGTGAQSGRTLMVKRVRINSVVTTGLTGGGYAAQWCLAFGHTAVSLATGETATAKAPRRTPLGFQAVASGAVAGTVLSDIDVCFQVPVAVQPGEFIATVKKKVGTAPSGGVIRHIISIEGYYE